MYMVWYPYRRYEVNVWWKYGQHIDIRVGLLIVNMDHVFIV